MAKRERPPRDSWIFLKAGQSVVMDVQAVHAERERLTRFGREVRGALLSSAYEIEWILDQILLNAFFPGQESTPSEQRSVFDDRLLKRGPLNIAYKITLLTELRKAIPIMAELLSEELITDLHTIRKFRNDFAHCPVILHPDGPEPIIKLKVVLTGSESDLDLTDESVTKLFELISKTTISLDGILKSLNEGVFIKQSGI